MPEEEKALGNGRWCMCVGNSTAEVDVLEGIEVPALVDSRTTSACARV